MGRRKKVLLEPSQTTTLLKNMSYEEKIEFNKVTIYKPGDPGFDEIAKTITPLNRIRNRAISSFVPLHVI
jgi:hypothetical protein